MANEALNKDIGYPESLVFNNDEELLEKLLEAEEDIRAGRVMSYEDFRREVFEKYGF